MPNTVTNDTQQVNLQTPQEEGSIAILTFFDTLPEESELPVVAQAVVAQAQEPVAQAKVLAQAPVAQERIQQALPYLIVDGEPVSPEIFTEEQARNIRLEARDSVSRRLDF
jgi:hypothetical protein